MRKDDYTPTERAVKLMDMYYHSMASTSMEWTYWYTRKFNEEEGELLSCGGPRPWPVPLSTIPRSSILANCWWEPRRVICGEPFPCRG